MKRRKDRWRGGRKERGIEEEGESWREGRGEGGERRT